MALTRMEADACSGCGRPISEAWSGDNLYTLDTQHCHGCETLESGKSEDLTAGDKQYLVPQSAAVPEGSKYAPVWD